MTIVVTGAAGFIGFHTCCALLAHGHRVVGVDNVNPYYSPKLKEARLKQLERKEGFTFLKADIADQASMETLAATYGPSITHVIHLAAQAGVRYSLEHPESYGHSNLIGHLQVLEFCRHAPKLKRLVYASSSSVYGDAATQPLGLDAATHTPISLYAATKQAAERMSYAYSHLYGIPMVGLRFFTVYGPWGRPDMAYFLFTRALLEETPITLFHEGKSKRDFTYIDDIVSGIVAAMEAPSLRYTGPAPHAVYNLGNDQPTSTAQMVQTLEQITGQTAKKELQPLQPGDVVNTWADITASRQDLGYAPSTGLKEGLKRFVAWYRAQDAALWSDM